MARLPTVGGDYGNWGTVLNEYLATAHNADGTLKLDVQTIADLKVIDVATLTDKQQALVAGYSAPGDGGGGQFYYDAAASTADNGGTIIAPTAGSGRWLRVYSAAVDVRWFGAKGDGAIDDTTAIQAAIDAADATGGGDVSASGGTFRVTATLLLYSKVTLDLGGSGTIEMTSDGIHIIDCTGSGAYPSRFAIINGHIKYTNRQSIVGGSAILLSKAGSVTSNWTLDRIKISNPYHGIYVPDNVSTFLGRIGLVSITDASSYATYIGGGTATHTHINITQLWANCTPGSEPAGSRGHYLANIEALNAHSLLADNIVGGTIILLQTCTGNVGTIQLESCDRSVTSGGLGKMIDTAGSVLSIGLISMVSNNVTLTGSSSFAIVSCDYSSRIIIDKLIDKNTNLSIGSGAYYQFYVGNNGTSALTASLYKVIGTSPAISMSGGWQPLRHIVTQPASGDIDTTGMSGADLANADKINTILSRLRAAGIIET